MATARAPGGRVERGALEHVSEFWYNPLILKLGNSLYVRQLSIEGRCEGGEFFVYGEGDSAPE